MADPTQEELNQLALEEAQAFEAGFTGDQAPAEVIDVVPELVEVEPVAEVPPVEDPQSGIIAEEPLVPAHETPVDSGTVENEKLLARMRNLEGHIGGLKSQLIAQQKSHEELAAAKPVVPTAEEQSIAFKDGEAFRKLKEDFPDWGNAMEESMTSLKTEILNNIPQAEAQNIDVAALRQEIQEEVLGEARLLQIEFKHEGWRDTVATDEFKNWLGVQPVEVQALANSPSPTHAIHLLDRYVSNKQAAVQQLQNEQVTQTSRLEAAVAPTTGGLSTPTQQPTTELDDFMAGFSDG